MGDKDLTQEDWFVGYYRMGWNLAASMDKASLGRRVSETRRSISPSYLTEGGEVKAMSVGDWKNLFNQNGNSACMLAGFLALTDYRAHRAPHVRPAPVSESYVTPA